MGVIGVKNGWSCGERREGARGIRVLVDVVGGSCEVGDVSIGAEIVCERGLDGGMSSEDWDVRVDVGAEDD